MKRSITNAPRAAAFFALLFTFLFAFPHVGYGQTPGAVAGTVTSAETGAPLPSVNVALEGTERGTATDADGQFEIAQVPPGTYTLRASFVGYETAARSVAVRAGETTRLNLTLAPRFTELGEVVVGGRAANLVGVAESAAQGRVGQAQLRTRPLLRTGEIMETVPGLITTQHSGSGKANQFFLRGFNLDHGTDFATSVEGVPINLRTHAHGQGYLDLNFLIPELIEAVEFERGPYFADAGDFATTGNAQIELMDRLDEGIAKAEVGADEYYRGLLANSQQVGGADLLYGFQGRYYNGPWVNPENGAKLSGVLKYTGGSDADGYSLNALGYFSDWNATDQIPRRAVESGRVSRFGVIDPTDGGRTGRYTLAGNWWSTSQSGARTRANAYAAYYHLNLFTNFTYFLENPTQGDQFEQADRRLYAGGDVSHQWPAGWLSERSTNTVGAELRHDQIFEVALFSTDDRERLGTVRNDAVAETSLGAYLENETQWADKFRTVAGVRADAFRFDVDSRLDANAGTEIDVIASPKLTLAFGPWFDTEYYLNLGLGYHSNDARGTTITVDPVSEEAVPSVDPLVQSRGAEVGARTAALPGLQSTVSLWYVGLESELLFVGDAGGTEASGASAHYGLEWTNFYRPLDGLAFNLDVALTESRFTEAPEGSDEIPNSIGRIITGGVAAGRSTGWQGSLRVRHFGPRPLTGDASVESKSTTLLNAKAGYRFGALELSADVLNLLDSEDPDIGYFFNSRLEGEPPGGVADVHFHPVLPRTARLSATWHF